MTFKGLVCLLLLAAATVQGQEEWSWGAEGKEAPKSSIFPVIKESSAREGHALEALSSQLNIGALPLEDESKSFVHEALPFDAEGQFTLPKSLPIEQEPLPLESQGGLSFTVAGEGEEVDGLILAQEGDREGRFLGLSEKLCSYGIGLNCDKKYPTPVKSHYGPPAKPLGVYGPPTPIIPNYGPPKPVIPKGGYGVPHALPPPPIAPNRNYNSPPVKSPSAFDGLLSVLKPFMPESKPNAPPKVSHGGIISPSYNSPNPNYASLLPSYNPPVNPTYVAPTPSYNVLPSAYSPPKPAYVPLKPAYDAAPVLKPAYNPPKPNYEQKVGFANPIPTVTVHAKPTVVEQHHHTHTHIYNGEDSQGVYKSGNVGVVQSAHESINNIQHVVHRQDVSDVSSHGSSHDFAQIAEPSINHATHAQLPVNHGNHAQLSTSNRNHAQTSTNIRNHAQLSTSNRNHAQTSTNIRNHAQLSTNNRNHAQTSTNIRNQAQHSVNQVSNTNHVSNVHQALSHVANVQVSGNQAAHVQFPVKAPSTPSVIPGVLVGKTDFIPGRIESGFQPSASILEPLFRPQQPTYREDCQCVSAAFCSDQDVIARSLTADISNVIDARSKKSNILSNATSSEDESDADLELQKQPSVRRKKMLDIFNGNLTVTEEPAEDDTDEATEDVTDVATESWTEDPEETTEVPVDEAELEKDVTRIRRDTNATAEESEAEEEDPAVIYSDRQGRQLTGFTPGANGCGPDHVCCRRPVFRPRRQQFACGRRNADGLLGRVKVTQAVEGNTDFGEYPWQAAILKRDDGDMLYVCGATLIDDRHVLTAAHCVDGMHPSQLKIRLGEWDVSGATEFYQHVEMRASGVYLHPEFYAGNLNNDIAVIRLENFVDFSSNPHITPVCLPAQFSDFTNKRCYATGWGKDAFGSTGKFSHVLKEVDVPVVDNYQCQQALQSTRLGQTFSLHEGNICAGGEEGRDTCKGDGGGPLVCSGPDGSIQLAGLVSWGIGCGHPGVPGVYVKVSHYLDWIRDITRV